MHDYDPNWDYPVIEIDDVQELTPFEKARVQEIISHVRVELAPALSLDNFEAFFTEVCGIHGGQAHGIYCNGTSSRPVIGFDLQLLKQSCDEHGESFTRQFEIALAHELAHAYQESLGLDHEHEDGFDEDDAEEFARNWVDWRSIDLHLIDPDHPKPGSGAKP